MTGHFLAFENLAGILTLTGRTVRTVRDRNTVRSAQTTEVVTLHRTGKTFTDGGAGHVHFLAF
ncbi:30S ribosomal protein S10 [Roseobacter sp. SK209-2-6]|nr:30S ribosomal protein S10 [Roseobacter sp. SK209-2-6]